MGGVSRRSSLVLGLAIALVGVGCGGGSPTPDESAATLSAPDAAQKAREAFEANQARIEAERQQREELVRHRKSFVHVTFVRVDDDGRVIVTLENTGERDIDDIRGGVHATDADGNYLASTGVTEAVPGTVFLPAGGSIEYAPYGFGDKESLVEQLRTTPANVVFAFEAMALTWADGSEEPGLDG